MLPRQLPAAFSRLLGFFLCLTLGASFTGHLAHANPNGRLTNGQITNVQVTGNPFCPGSSVKVNLTTQGTFPGDVKYQLQLVVGSKVVAFETTTQLTNNSVDIPTSVTLGTDYQIKAIAFALGSNVLDEQLSGKFAIVSPIATPSVAETLVCNYQPITITAKKTCQFIGIQKYEVYLSDKQGNFDNEDFIVIMQPLETLNVPSLGNPAAGTYRIRLKAIYTNGASVYSAPSNSFKTQENDFTGAPIVTNAPVCPGGTISVSIRMGCGLPGASYHVLLSDAQGNFASPTHVTSFSQSAGGEVKLPDNLPVGSQYRIKIRTQVPGKSILSPASEPFAITNVSPTLGTPTVSGVPACPGGLIDLTIPLPCKLPTGTTYKVSLSDGQGKIWDMSLFGVPLSSGVSEIQMRVFLVNFVADEYVPIPAGTNYKLKVIAMNNAVELASTETAGFEVKSTCPPDMVALPAALTGFVATTEAPSNVKTFSLSAVSQNAVQALTIDIPDAFELSLDGQTYQSDDTLLVPFQLLASLKAPLMVRLKSGLTPGNYSRKLKMMGLSLNGFSYLEVPLEGVVNPSVPGENKPPVLTGGPQSLTAAINTLFTYTFPADLFTDPEGQPLTWSVMNLPDELTLTNKTISGTFTKSGFHLFTVQVVDPGGLNNMVSCVLVVTDAVSPTPPSSPTSVTSVTPVDPSLQLLPPDYNCQTGAFVFKTSGGDGTPIEYMAIGITGWTTNPSQLLDEGLRTATDTQPFLLRARQSGKVVSLSWDKLAQCQSGGQSPQNPAAFKLIAPDYNCQTGAFAFKTSGGNGAPIEYMAIGITGWTTNPSQFVDGGLRTANDVKPLTLRARQNGQEVTYVWDLLAQCSQGGARLARTITDEAIRISLSAYPNPVVEELTVEVSGAGSEPVTCRLQSLEGRILTEQRDTTITDRRVFRFDLRQQPAGLYLIQAATASGQAAARVVK